MQANNSGERAKTRRGRPGSPGRPRRVFARL